MQDIDTNGEGSKGARPVMSVRDVSETLGVSESFVHTLLREGTLTRIKLGSRTLISRKELNSLIAV